MVSRPARRRAAGRPSRDRIADAAAGEFAARGFDGATVDRIAVRAGVNKAMLYYHFGSKAALYREILHDMFAGVAAAVLAVRERGGPPAAQIRGFVDAVRREAAARPHFPAIWLRELAEAGRHLDAGTVGQMRRVIEALGGMLADGQRAGEFAPAHPFVVHIGIVAPLLFFSASAPVRERFAHLMPALPDPDAVAAHVVSATLSVLIPPPRRGTRRRPVAKRQGRSR